MPSCKADCTSLGGQARASEPTATPEGGGRIEVGARLYHWLETVVQVMVVIQSWGMNRSCRITLLLARSIMHVYPFYRIASLAVALVG